MENSNWVFTGRTRVILTSMLAYKNTSSLQCSIAICDVENTYKTSEELILSIHLLQQDLQPLLAGLTFKEFFTLLTAS